MVESGSQTPQPSSIAPPELGPGEIEFLRLAGTSLRRLSTVQSLVRHPHKDAVHEIRQRLSIAPAAPVDVLVTSHRIIFGNTTYVPANITSVTYHDHVKRLGCAYASFGCGGLMLLFALCPVTALMSAMSETPLRNWGGTVFMAVAMLVLGALFYRAATDQFSVTITTSGGGMDGFISRDRQTIQALRGAIQRSVTVGE